MKKLVMEDTGFEIEVLDKTTEEKIRVLPVHIVSDETTGVNRWLKVSTKPDDQYAAMDTDPTKHIVRFRNDMFDIFSKRTERDNSKLYEIMLKSR